MVLPTSGACDANYFDVLQARPALGRFFVADEDAAPGSATVAVVSHRFWTERLAGDPAAVGRSIRLNGTPFTVVGVAAEGFHGSDLMSPDLWVPLTASTFRAGAGIRYRLEQSKDLVSWTVHSTIGPFDQAGEVSVPLDPAVTAGRFYRLAVDG